MATTFRYDAVDGILAMLNGVVTAHPTLLLRAYRARPTGFPDLPAAFIDARPETVTQDTGIRTRDMSPSFVVVREATDNAEAMEAFDVLVDILVDAVTADPQFGTTGIHRGDFSVSDEEYPIGDYLLPAVRFTLGSLTIQEGRT